MNISDKQNQTDDFILVEFAKYKGGRLIETHREYSIKSSFWHNFLKDVKYEEHSVYDDLGNLIEVEYYCRDKEYISRCRNDGFVSLHSYEYDHKGNETSHYFFQIGIDLELEIETFYDKKYRMEKQIFNRYWYKSNLFYEYDKKHNCSKIVSRTTSVHGRYATELDDKNKIHEYTFSYHYRGVKLFEERCFGRNGKLLFTIKFVFNRKNCLIEKNVYDRNNILFSKIVALYDENNAKTEAQRWAHKNYWKGWTEDEHEKATMFEFML